MTPGPVHDRLGRPLHDLRVSVTDRCNFRCPYCMPAAVFGPGHAFLPKPEILSFEEIGRVVRVAVRLGVRKVRLTGGEPLLRRELPVLVRMLSGFDGVRDLALTTNGLLLARHAASLRAAGLHRVTVSLDALDPVLFAAMSGTEQPVGQVLEGIAAAAATGLLVKINCVVQRGVNETEILPLASWCRERGHTLRFIEYMDVGNHNHWEPSRVVPAAELRAILDAAFGILPQSGSVRGEVARRFAYADGLGEVGFVASITEPFCRDCNRARLTADGKIVTCLFASGGTDLRGLLRSGADDAAVAAQLSAVWAGRTDRYSELRDQAASASKPKAEMSYLGG